MTSRTKLGLILMAVGAVAGFILLPVIQWVIGLVVSMFFGLLIMAILWFCLHAK